MSRDHGEEGAIFPEKITVKLTVGQNIEFIEVPARHIRSDMYAVLLPDNEYAAWVTDSQIYVSRFRTLEEFQRWGWLPSH